jgi:hypothetical protein
VQRTAAALGLAILIAVVTATQAQMLADRSALMGSDTPVPTLGTGQEGGTLGLLLTYQQTSNMSFVEALDNLMVINTVITLIGAALALLLRSGKVRAAPADATPTGSDGAASAAPIPPGPSTNDAAATDGHAPAGERHERQEPVRARG